MSCGKLCPATFGNGCVSFRPSPFFIVISAAVGSGKKGKPGQPHYIPLPRACFFPLGTALMIGSTAPIERAPPLNSACDRSWCALWEQGTNMSGVPHLLASGGGQFISVCLPQ